MNVTTPKNGEVGQNASEEVFSPIELCPLTSDSSSYDYYDAVRAQLGRRVDAGEIEVKHRRVIPVNISKRWCADASHMAVSRLLSGDASADDGSDEEEAIHLRHISYFAPLTNVSFAKWTVDTLASALLAIHHWNNGIGDVVPAVEDASRSCSIKFTVDIFDSAASIPETVRQLREEVLSRATDHDQATATPQHPDEPEPTVILGGVLSKRTRPLSVLANVYSIPVVSYVSQATEYNNKDQYPYFARTVTSNDVNAVMAADFFKHVLNSRHVAVIYQRDEYGSSYRRSFQEAASAMDLAVSTAAILERPQPSNASDVSALRPLCHTLKLRHFILMMSDEPALRIMEVAARMDVGCTGPGTFWVKTDSTSFPRKRFEVGSLLIEALNGTATMSFAHSPAVMEGRPGYDRFVSSYWPQPLRSDADFTDYIRRKIPESYVADPQSPKITSLPNFDSPDLYVFMAYDAVMDIAMSSCDAEKNANNGTNDGILFNASDFQDAFVQRQFDGIFGRVAIDNVTRSRTKGILPYVVKNVLASEELDDDGKVFFHIDPVYVYEKSTPRDGSSASDLEARWKLVDDAVPFYYADGTTQPPPSYPPLETNLKLASLEATVFCAILTAITMGTSIGFLVWTVVAARQGGRVVKAAQPVFLIVLCVGTFIMTASMIPLILIHHRSPSVDTGSEDGVEVDEQSLDILCMSVPWLFYIGFVLAFSSLFTKLMRINKIFKSKSFRRFVVRGRDVSRPFITFLVLHMILLVLWTFIAPLKFRLVVETGVTDKYRRFTDRHPSCFSGFDSGKDYIFWIALFCMDFLVVVIANWEAYLARTIPCEFSESQYIAVTMASILQAFLIGLPVFVGVNAQTRGRLVVSTLLVVVVNMAILLPIFVPKILLHIRNPRPTLSAKRTNGSRASTRESAVPHDDRTPSPVRT